MKINDWRVLRSLVCLLVEKLYRKALRLAGEFLRKNGRKLVIAGTYEDPNWSPILLWKSYRLLIRIHVGNRMYSGPIVSLYQDFLPKGTNNKVLIANLNWVADRGFGNKGWDGYSGACSFILPNFGSPRNLEGVPGAIWFTFDGGYAVIGHEENPKNKLVFKGDQETPRTYSYF